MSRSTNRCALSQETFSAEQSGPHPTKWDGFPPMNVSHSACVTSCLPSQNPWLIRTCVTGSSRYASAARHCSSPSGTYPAGFARTQSRQGPPEPLLPAPRPAWFLLRRWLFPLPLGPEVPGLCGSAHLRSPPRSDSASRTRSLRRGVRIPAIPGHTAMRIHSEPRSHAAFGVPECDPETP